MSEKLKTCPKCDNTYSGYGNICPQCGTPESAEFHKNSQANKDDQRVPALRVNTQIELGSYVGTCTNTTGKEPVVSSLKLAITRQEQEGIHGKLTTTGALELDLAFSGTINGSSIRFVTTTLNNKLTVEWSGAIENDSLRGTFSTTNSGFWAKLFGKKHQRGEWQCKIKRPASFAWLATFARRVVYFGIACVAFACGIGLMESNSNSGSKTSSFTSAPSTAPSTTFVPTEPQPAYKYDYQPIPKPAQPQPSGAWESVSRFANDPQVQDMAWQAASLLLQQKGSSGPPKDVHVHSYTDRNGRFVPDFNRAHPNSSR